MGDRDRNVRGRERERSDSRGKGDRGGAERPRGGDRDGGRGFERQGATTSLLVRNLSYRVTCDEIRRVFTGCGEIRDVYIPQDYYTKEPRGFAFVEFFDKRDASQAMDRFDRFVLEDREISIVFAKDRRKTADEMRPRGGRADSRDRGRGNDRGGDRRRDERRDDRRRSPSRSRSRDRGGRGNNDRRDERPNNRRSRSPPRRGASPPRRGASPPARSPPRRGTSPARRGESPPASPAHGEARRSRSRSASRSRSVSPSPPPRERE